MQIIFDEYIRSGVVDKKFTLGRTVNDRISEQGTGCCENTDDCGAMRFPCRIHSKLIQCGADPRSL